MFIIKFHILKGACIITVLLCSILLLTGCKPKGIDLLFTTVERNPASSSTGYIYESPEPGLVLITQAEDIISVDRWIENKSVDELKKLDYKKNLALLVFQGKKGSSGYGVKITRILRQGNTVSVYTQFTEQDVNRLSYSVISSPYHLVKLEKTGTWGEEITFRVMVDGKVVVSSSHYIP